MLLFCIQAKDSKFSPEQQLSEFTFSLSHPEASLKFPAATEKVHTRYMMSADKSSGYELQSRAHLLFDISGDWESFKGRHYGYKNEFRSEDGLF
jgi:hypothetical protein